MRNFKKSSAKQSPSKWALYERGQKWSDKKELYLEEERAKLKDVDLIGCSFKPRLVITLLLGKGQGIVSRGRFLPHSFRFSAKIS